MPRTEEEVGCCNPQSACKPPWDDKRHGSKEAAQGSRLPADGNPQSEVSALGTRSLALPPPCPGLLSLKFLAAEERVQFQSRGGGGSSAQGSLQPGCWGALMGCGRRGFGPLGLRRERNPGLPLPQHIL